MAGRQLPQRSATSTTTLRLTEQQVRQVNAFYGMVRTAYPRQFETEFSDEKTLKQSKRFWTADICALTAEQLDRGFKELRRRRIRQDEKFQWPDIGAIIGLCRASVRNHPSHKPFAPALPYKQTEEAREVGNRHLDGLKGLL